MNAVRVRANFVADIVIVTKLLEFSTHASFFPNLYWQVLPNNNWWIKQNYFWQTKPMTNKDKRGLYPKNYIRELRDQRGLKLRDLEKLTGWSNQTLSNLELSKADLTVSKLRKLAEILQCHPSDITDGPAHSPPRESDMEAQLLATFRGLSDGAKQMYLHTLKSFATDVESPKEKKKPDNGKRSSTKNK